MTYLVDPPVVGGPIEVRYAVSGSSLDGLRALVGEYARSVIPDGASLSAADEALVASLPGVFVPYQGAALIASVDGVPIGCVLLRPPHRPCRTPEITKLYVRPEWRRAGAALALMNEVAALAAANGHRTVHLVVSVDNEAAAALYEQLGFCDLTDLDGDPSGLRPDGISHPHEVPEGFRVLVGETMTVVAASHRPQRRD